MPFILQRVVRRCLLPVLFFPAAALSQVTVTWIDGAGNSNWNNSANWNSATPGPGDIARFSSATVKDPNVSSNTSVGELLFANGSDAKSFAGGKTLTVNGVGGIGIDNQTGLVQTFANKFALGGNQTWKSSGNGGGLTFNGTINLAGNNLTLSLAASGSSLATLDGNISGSGGSLTIDGNGTVILGAAASYTGATTIDSGATLQISGGGTLASSTDVIVNAGGAYDLNGTSDTVSTIAGAGSIKLGGGKLTTGGNGSTVFSGVISDGGMGGAIDKRGSGTLTLSGANTFSGGVALNAGTIAVGSDAALGTGTLDLSGGTLFIRGDHTLANDLAMSGSSTIAANPGVSLVFSSNTIAPASGTLTLDNVADGGTHFSVGFSGSGGGFLFDRAIAFDDSATDLAFLNTTGVQTFSGIISGAGNLVRNGAGGTTILSGNNSFTGSVTVTAGTLQIASDRALGATPGVATPGLLVFNGGTLRTTASFALNANRGLTLDAGGGFLAPDSGTTLTFGGIIAGPGELTQTGAGTLLLTGGASNTSTGLTSVNAGTLALDKTGGATAVNGDLLIGDGVGTDTVRLDAGNQIADTSRVTLGASGVFNVNGQTETIGGLDAAAAAAQVQLGSGSLTIDSAAASAYAGTISGSGTLAKAGSGTLSLSGNSASFSGATDIAGGVVALQNGGALGTSAVSVLAGAALELQGGIATGAGSLHLSGSGIAGGGALRSTAGANAWNGAITLDADARINADAGTLTLGGGIASASNQNLTLGGTGNISVTNVIALGAGTLTKDGAGMLTISSNVTLGNVALNSGVLQFTGSMPSIAGSLTLAGGTLLLTGDTSLTVGTLHITGDTVIDFGSASASILNVSTLVIDSGVSVTVNGWASLEDYFYSQNFPGVVPGETGAPPENQVTFAGYSNTTTGWQSFDNQIRPIPEAPGYGSLLLLGAVALIGYRRRPLALSRLWRNIAGLLARLPRV
ncbi:MAG TPA: autotransporter-associated beta strand repeat-containing protein [Opitutaceae bacterium]|nr:autotransporter-associated beta strand repeat-containing protein [Opitutaceae bacterium]